MVVRGAYQTKHSERGRMLLCNAETVEHRPRVEM